MRYGVVLSESWKALWRSWALWGFLAVYIAVSGVVALVAGGAITALFLTALEGSMPDIGMVALVSALAAIGGLALLPVYWFFHGGAIHLSNEALEGRPVRFSDGIAAGRRNLGALAGFETLFYGVMLGIGLVVGLLTALVFGVVIAGTMNAGDSAIGAGIIMLMCLYVVLFAAGTVAMLFTQAFEAIGARAAILSGRGGREAFSDAWTALRGSFKQVVVMGLIIIGVTWAYSTVMGFVLVPLQFLFYPQMMTMDETTFDAAQFFTLFGTFYIVYGLASLLITFPLSVYLYHAWTAFYRQLVGIAPEEAPVPLVASPGEIPPPPVPPPPPPGSSDSPLQG